MPPKDPGVFQNPQGLMIPVAASTLWALIGMCASARDCPARPAPVPRSFLGYWLTFRKMGITRWNSCIDPMSTFFSLDWSGVQGTFRGKRVYEAQEAVE